MDTRVYNVLFLCTGNSARSILAEALLNHLGKGQFNAYSAGSLPKGAVHPLALDLLERLSLPTTGLHSKSWKEFARPGAPVMDFVFTVCDQAAGVSARSGPVIRSPRIGAFPIRLPSKALTTSANGLSATPTTSLMRESGSSSRCRSTSWTAWLSSAAPMRSVALSDQEES